MQVAPTQVNAAAPVEEKQFPAAQGTVVQGQAQYPAGTTVINGQQQYSGGVVLQQQQPLALVVQSQEYAVKN